MSSQQKRSQTGELNLIFFSIPQQILLQLSTGPVLLALLAGKAAAQTLQAIGAESEEIFRGELLPVLKFPPSIKSESSLDESC